MNKNVIDKANPKPLYQQIVDWVRTKIDSKEWDINFQLPSEEVLAKQLEVSRGTMRKAISCLIQEEILIQIHGKGTFVAEKNVSHPFGQELISFAESMERNGLNFKTKVIEKKKIEADQFLQDKFFLQEGQLMFYLKRVRYIDDEPVILIENYINPALCIGIEQVDFEHHTLFEAIERLSGQKISHGKRKFDARALNTPEAKWLNMEVDSPILFLDQITYLEETLPVEASNAWLRSDKYSITSYLHRG